MCFEKAGAGGLACTNTFDMKACQYFQPDMPDQIFLKNIDIYEFESIKNQINAESACFSDDKSENGFVKDLNQASEKLIATAQTGTTNIVETTEEHGDYANVRLCFKKST